MKSYGGAARKIVGLSQIVTSDTLFSGLRLDDFCVDRTAALKLQERNHPGKLVEAYTLCQLSDPEDRLHALTGVAKVFTNIWQDTIVFGMPRSFFVQQFGWQIQEARSLVRKPCSNRAPSWSWASLDCPILFSSGPFLSDAEVEAGLTENL